ncbi:MAG: hypothetical protein ACKVOK_11810 [Flavobacteriales bacterium]
MFIRRDEDDIDRIFRQRLKNAEEPFPGHLWEGIRTRSSRKRRIPPFWFIAAIVISGALGFGLYHSDPGSSQLTQSETSTLESPQATSKVEDSQLQNLTSPDSEKSSPISEKSNPSTPKSSPDEKSKRQTASTNSESNKAVYGETSETKLPAVAHMSAEKNSRSHPEIESKNPAPNFSIQTIENAGEEIQKTNDDLGSQMEVHASDPLNEYTSGAIDTTNEPQKVEEALQTPGLTSDRVAENETSLDEKEPFIAEEELKLPEAPVALAAASPFAIGVYASMYRAHRQMDPDFSGNNLTATDNGKINLPEDDAQGMAIGVGAQYSLSKWVYLSAGIEYSRMKEHTHFNDIYLSGTPTYVNQMDTSWLFTETDTSLTIGLATVPSDSIWTSHEKTELISNSYQSLNIPLTAGLSWTHKRLFVGLEAGPVFRFRKTYSGLYRYDDKLIPTEASLSPSPYDVPQISEGNSFSIQEVYSKWSMDLHAALRLGYSITPHFAVQGALQYRVMKKTIHHEYIGDHRIVMPGVSLGLYYRF